MYRWRHRSVSRFFQRRLLQVRLGPITVLNKTIFDVVANRPDGPNYLQFVGWVYLWGAILHWITAALNCTMRTTRNSVEYILTIWTGCNLLQYVTLFSCDTFGFFVSWVRSSQNAYLLVMHYLPFILGRCISNMECRRSPDKYILPP